LQSSADLRYLDPTVRLLVLVLLLAVASSRSSYAGDVDDLVNTLKNDSSDKNRLSAALNLARLGDGSTNVLLALSKSLLNDNDKNVRGACALALGKLVTSSTKGSIKGLVVSNLKQAIANDDSDVVKQQAQKALTAITGQAGTAPTAPVASGGGKGGIYVNIGPMSSRAGSANDAKLRALMVKVANQTLAKVAGKMQTSWPGGVPSKSVLAQTSVSGFYVDGTLNSLTSSVSGSSATITCKVSMLLADFPDKNMFGFLNGGASVQGAASASEQALAGEDCVSAVIEDLIAKKIVPTICSKASCP
jgi:hypothetical protein